MFYLSSLLSVTHHALTKTTTFTLKLRHMLRPTLHILQKEITCTTLSICENCNLKKQNLQTQYDTDLLILSQVSEINHKNIYMFQFTAK